MNNDHENEQAAAEQAVPVAQPVKEAKKAAKKEKKPLPPGEKRSIWSVLLGVVQLAVAGAYGFFAVKSFMNFASEDAIDIVETAVDELGMQDIVISENLLMFVGVMFAVLALMALVSTVFLILQKRVLKRASMYMSIAAELIAVVCVALFFAFKANLFFLLYGIPHLVWFAIVIAYTAVSTNDPLEAARRKAEKEAKRLAKKEAKAKKAQEENDEESEEEEEQEESPAVVKTEAAKEEKSGEERGEDSAEFAVVADPVTKKVAVSAAAKKTVVKKVIVEEEEDVDEEPEEEVVVVKKKKKTKQKPKAKKKKWKIRHVLYWIIASVHMALLGLVLFVGSVINAIASNSEDYDIMFQNFLRDFEIRDIVISKTQLMSVFILHAVVSIVFIVTGIGLLRRSKRFADITKFFSIGLLVFMALSLLMQGFASFTIMMGVYFAWFLFVSIYFQVAKLDGFLKEPIVDEEEDDDASNTPTLTDL
jgi:hypothetical protein